ncbi:MAG: tetratricopeptide repeat protein, partial [Terracidiphilus sp.]
MPKLQILTLSWCLAALAAWAAPERNSPQQELAVVVVNAHADPAQPVQGVRVSLSFVSGSEKVVDARDATNRAGQALLLVSAEAAQRGNLRIEITGVTGLVVYTPADGQLIALPVTVTVQLLPKGSPALLGPAQIEAMLHRLSVQSNAKSQEIRALKGELAAAQGQKPDDLTVAMTAWATSNGFAIAEADKQVHQWAEEIQQRKDQATAEQKALAELALKHYGVAAQLFNQAVDDIGQSMDEDEKKFLEERRAKLRDLVDKSFQSSEAYQLNSEYHQATQILEQACVRAAAEHGRYPEDAPLRGIWLETELRVADARRDEGVVGEASESSSLLTQSIKDYLGLLQAYSGTEEREDWSKTQNGLGLALWRQGERSSGAQATESLAQAVVAYRAALEVRTKADLPQDWATTQNDLGLALWDQALRGSGTQATELLAQAVVAYRAALEVRTKANLPQDWAKTQNGLGIALMDQGTRSSGAKAMELLAQAVVAYRAALEVLTKANLPQDWATTQNNLGDALVEQGERSSGAQATDLLAQAVQAFRAALEVRTKATLPQDFAKAQNNLGYVLRIQGERSSGAQAAELFAQAVEAYRAALEVQTKAGLPQDWARTQNNLGAALWDQGTRSSGAQATDLLAQAVEAFRAALEVYTKADLPQDWADAQSNLGVALTDQGERSGGAQATELFAQAVVAFRAALEVRTRATLPKGWAKTQDGLGYALTDQGDFTGASNAFEASLEAFPDNVGFLQGAVPIYHDKLFRYDRAYELTVRWLKLDDSTDARLEMVEADLTTSRFEDCSKQAALIDDAAFPAPVMPMVLVRDTMKLTCQWGAGQKAAAQETEKVLMSKSAQMQQVGWQSPGTRHFLASSPAFEQGRSSWIALFE